MSETAPARPSSPSFVSGRKKHLIGGQWVESASGKTIDVVNPATGELLCAIAQGDAHDVDLAVTAARRAYEGEWSRWTPHQRRRLMMRIHDVVMDNFDEVALIETLDNGAPLLRTRALREWTSQVIHFYASQADAGGTETLKNSLPGHFLTLKHKVPAGVIGGIIPWNAPLIGQWWIYGPVLATGCTTVLKPAEDASLSALRIADLITEAGVPDGVINIVTGYGAEAGQALAEHMDVDRVAFTGSVETARHVVRASTGNFKRIQLELGGKSPDIVFADADLDKAVPGAAMGVYTNSGQICVAGTRIFVQQSIQEEFVERMNAFRGTIRVGNGLDPETQIGPLISERQRNRVMNYIDIGNEEGARLVGGGARPGGDLASGFFVEPTIFSDVSNDMTIAREEIFGPVASIIPFDDIDDALRLANDSPYGLAGGVWTRNLSTAHRVSQGIQSGTIWVNCYGVLDPAIGFGGQKLSGYGWKGAAEHMESFLSQKAVYFNLD